MKVTLMMYLNQSILQLYQIYKKTILNVFASLYKELLEHTWENFSACLIVL